MTKAFSGLGLKVYPSQTNFVLVQFPDEGAHSAENADAFLNSKGIVARRLALDDFANKLLFTVGLDNEMEATVTALKAFMSRS